MIRINLLPLEDRKKSRSISLPSLSGTAVIWPVAILGVFFVMVFAMSTLQSRRVKGLEAKIAEARKESAALAPQLQRIRKLTKEREEVNKRLGIIASLDRDRYLRVKMLNAVGEKLPANCWLTSLLEKDGSMARIEGVTFSNYIVADFMNNLERSGRFEEIKLILAQEGQIKDYNVVKFSLESTISSRTMAP